MGYKFVLLACLVAVSWAQDATEAPLDDLETTPSTNISTTTVVSILRQINKVNDDGTYTYGFEAADGTFKIETRDDQGNVKGKYGFLDEFGELKIVEYSAGNGTGFEAESNLLPQQVTPVPVPVIPQELPSFPSLPPRPRFPQRATTQFGAPQFPQQQFASSQPEPQFSSRPRPFGRPQSQNSPRPQPQPQLISRPETETPSRFNTRRPTSRPRPQPQLPRPASPRPQDSVPQPFPQQSQFPGRQFPQQPQFSPQSFPQQPQFSGQEVPQQPQFPPQSFQQQPQFPPQGFPQQPQFTQQQFPQQPQFFPQQQTFTQRPRRPINIALDGFSEDRNQDGFVDGSPEEAAKGNPVNPIVPPGTSLLPAGTSPLPRPPQQGRPFQPQPQSPFAPRQPQSPLRPTPQSPFAPQSPFSPQQPQSPFTPQQTQNPFFSNQVPQGFNRFATPQPQGFPGQSQLSQLTPQQIQQIQLIRQQQLLAAQQGQFPQGQFPQGQFPQQQFPQQQFPKQQFAPQQFSPQQFGQQPLQPQQFSDPRFAAQQFEGQQFPSLFGGQPSASRQFTPRLPPRQPVTGFRPRPASPTRTRPVSATPVQTKKPETSAVEP